MTPGTRIGAFEVVSVLGIGGMGEVYRATDSRLKRQVAIKILPASFSADEARLSRMQREAELLASLNHPNIASIFGIEDTEAGMALVMELVEGVDLRERIARGKLPLAEALPLALQLARAINAAHDRGIVHRDLKPGNIRLRPDGTIKVLDFGLAKDVTPRGPGDATMTATHAGVIMGTPRYMSPEQVRGEATETQTDIWAFGVVLYEMLTGRAPFDAPSSAETLSHVLTSEPDFTRLPAHLPPRIRMLLERCLRKNVQQRLHHIGDAAIEIEDAQSAPLESQSSARASRWPIGIAAAAIFASIVVASSWLMRDTSATSTRMVSSDIVVPGPLGTVFGARSAAMSRDGLRIAIAAPGGLLIRRLDEPEYITIPGSASNPFFSPDGRWIAYFSAGDDNSGVTIVPATGGALRPLAANADRPAGGDWRADGTIVFATTGGLFLVREDGTGLRTLARPDAAAAEQTFAFPQFLPDTNAVLFTIASTGTPGGFRLARIDLDTSRIDRVLEGGSAARYLPGGRLVYAARDRLMTVPFDPRRPSIAPDSAVDTGVAITIAPDNGAADFAVSDLGDVLYLSPSNRFQTMSRLAWMDRQGRREDIDVPPQPINYPRVSPDGTRLVMDVHTNGNRDVWVHDLRQQRMTQLTFGPTEDNQPIWSRDGKRVYFASNRSGDFDIYSRAADGATDDRLELAAPRVQFPSSTLPDGSGMFVLEDFVDTGLLRFPQPKSVERVLTGKPSARLAELSPDGRWLAYESTETGSIQVFVRPFPNVNDRREQVSPSGGGRYPLWNPKGNGELFFVTADGDLMSASVAPDMTVRTVTKLFFLFKPPPRISGRPYDYSQIHDRFVFQETQVVTDTPDARFKLITNWIGRE